MMSSELSYQQRNKFPSDAELYVWKDPVLCKSCGDAVYGRCLPEDEVPSVVHHFHASPYGGRFGPAKTIVKVSQSTFIGPLSLKMHEPLL